MVITYVATWPVASGGPSPSRPLRQFGLVPLYDPSIAFAVKATAGKLPPGEGGASPCSAGLAAKPLHHAATTFTPPVVRALWPRHSTTRGR